MADLDDFFAKKDKKKPKGKKFTTTEEVAKKLVETGKLVIEKPKLKEKSTNNPEDEGSENPQIEEEDEWREFEEKGKTDHTGLKIGQMKIDVNADGSTNDNDKGTGNDSDENEYGEGGSSASAWKKNDEQKETTSETNAPIVQEKTSVTKTTGPTAYKPPGLRNQPPMSTGRSRMKNVAPDIRSEEYFPTLSAKQPSAEPVNTWGRKKRDEGTFEEVRNRGSSKAYSLQESQSQAPKLSLDNKFGALSQDQS